MTSTRCSGVLARQPSAMVLGLLQSTCSNAPSGSPTMNTLVPKICMLLMEGKTTHSIYGRFNTNPDIRPSPLIPPPRGGGCEYLQCAVKRTGDGREQRGWTAPRTTHPLSGVGLPLLYSRSKVKLTGRGRGWKPHFFMALFFPEHLERPSRQGTSLDTTRSSRLQ